MKRINEFDLNTTPPCSDDEYEEGEIPRSPSEISEGLNDQANQIIYTGDNVKLGILFRKKLTCSDVGRHGRILLPKKGVEKNLRGLATKEGVNIALRNIFSNTEWRVKFRFWANQKGNIYLFDDCADFVKENSLEEGDYLELYRDDQTNLYFTIKKKEKHAAETSNLQENMADVGSS